MEGSSAPSTGSKADSQQLIGQASLTALSVPEIFERVPLGVAYCRMIYEDGQPVDLQYLYTNPYFHQITGLGPVDGKCISEIIPGVQESDRWLIETYGRVATTGQPTTFTNFVVGLQQWFSVQAFSPRPGYFIAVFTVVTACVEAEHALQESEERFRSLLEDQTEVIARFLPDGTFVFVNEVYCRLFGKTPNELIGKCWQPVAHPDDLPMIEAKLAEMSPEHPVVTIENRVYLASGELRWMQFVNRGLFIADGSLKEIQSVGRDITSLKQTEANLRESEETLERAQSVGRIGSFVMGEDTETFRITSVTAQLFDLGDEKVTTFAKWFSRVHPDDQREVEAAWRAALQGAPYDMTYRIVAKGKVRWIRALAELEFDKQEDLLRAVGTVQDISDLKQAEAALLVARTNAEQANQTKTRFLAATSHDLRQPMAAIGLYLDILAKSSLNESQSNIVARIRHSSDTLNIMLNALLDVAKLDSGAMTATFSLVRTSEVLSWIEADFSEQFNANGVRLDCFCSRNAVALRTDFALLKSIIINLLSNTLKYYKVDAKDKRRVLFSIRRYGQRALIQVWDNGIGIAPEHLGHVFEEYFQVSNAEREITKGLGLGLSIVARKARLIGAEVACRSQFGRGSVFDLWLPLGELTRETSVEQPLRHQIDIRSDVFAGKRLVLIEDNVGFREAMMQALRMHGIDVEAFGDAESALETSQISKADFYISDFRLPGDMNGFQLLDEIQRRKQSSIKGILLTGESLAIKLRPSGCCGWPILLKPCSVKTLLETLASLP